MKNLVVKINKEINCSCETNQDCDLQQCINQICQNKIAENTAWETVLNYKKKAVEEFNKSVTEKWTQEDKRLNEEKSQLAPLQSTVEKIMLDITEKSLQTLLNENEGKSLDVKIRELYKKLFVAEDSQSGDSISFLDPNESCKKFVKFFFGKCENVLLYFLYFTDDIEENEISKLKNGLNYIGLKKRLEFLKSELERINEDCERKKIYLEEKDEVDKKLLESRNKLVRICWIF